MVPLISQRALDGIAANATKQRDNVLMEWEVRLGEGLMDWEVILGGGPVNDVSIQCADGVGGAVGGGPFPQDPEFAPVHAPIACTYLLDGFRGLT